MVASSQEIGPAARASFYLAEEVLYVPDTISSRGIVRRIDAGIGLHAAPFGPRMVCPPGGSLLRSLRMRRAYRPEPGSDRDLSRHDSAAATHHDHTEQPSVSLHAAELMMVVRTLRVRVFRTWSVRSFAASVGTASTRSSHEMQPPVFIRPALTPFASHAAVNAVRSRGCSVFPSCLMDNSFSVK